MFKNILFFSVLYLIVSTTIFAQPINCKKAEDSILMRKNRSEIAYYYPVKFQPEQYFYYVFSNKRYSKKEIPIGSLSSDFLKCYNKESQKLLDSIFKVDFFRKADSILNSYDKTGRGYRNTDFPGGAGTLQNFLDKKIILPKEVKPSDADKFIRVYYSFVVDETGVISEIKMVKSNCKDCEEPVLEAIKKMPPFIPATEAGYPKKVKYILPFIKKM